MELSLSATLQGYQPLVGRSRGPLRDGMIVWFERKRFSSAIESGVARHVVTLNREGYIGLRLIELSQPQQHNVLRLAPVLLPEDVVDAGQTI